MRRVAEQCDSCRQGDDWVEKMTDAVLAEEPWEPCWRNARHAHALCEGGDCDCSFCRFWKLIDAARRNSETR